MVERRGARGVRDSGIRTRRNDLRAIPTTPHGLPVWISTFNQRWVDHLKAHHHDADQGHGQAA
jgi:hypothetical protein